MEKNRREFLKKLGAGGGNSVLAAAIAGNFVSTDDAKEKLASEIEKLKEAYEKLGAEKMRTEIEALKESFEKLDNKSKLMIRAVFAMSGLDIFLSL